MNKLKNVLKSLGKRCTWLAHEKHLINETRKEEGAGRVVITQHYECPYCGYKWNEQIVVDPNYQIDFHEI